MIKFLKKGDNYQQLRDLDRQGDLAFLVDFTGKFIIFIVQKTYSHS